MKISSEPRKTFLNFDCLEILTGNIKIYKKTCNILTQSNNQINIYN